MNADITLVVTFSRRWAVERFFKRLSKMDMGGKKWSLLVVNNTRDDMLHDELAAAAGRVSHKFCWVEMVKTGRKMSTETVTHAPGGWDSSKLPNIEGMHADIVEKVKTDMFVVIEDDTLPPFHTMPDAALRLVRTLESRDDVGLVTAIETSRGIDTTTKVRTGVHLLDTYGEKVLGRVSLPPWLRGVHEVDGCGWYFFAARMDAWKDGWEGVRPYMKNLPRWAFDNMQTHEMVRAGWKVLADFGIWCRHMNITPGFVLMWGREDAVVMVDEWLPGWLGYAEGVTMRTPEQEDLVRRMVRKRCPTWKP